MKIGAPTASQLAPKFAAIEAAGFRAGRRHRLTVVDIDSPDDRLMACFGVTIARQNPSGGSHLYFRDTARSGYYRTPAMQRSRTRLRCLRLLPTADMIEMVVTGASAEAIQEHLEAVTAASERRVAAADAIVHWPAVVTTPLNSDNCNDERLREQNDVVR
jgi:hypothetical protein